MSSSLLWPSDNERCLRAARLSTHGAELRRRLPVRHDCVGAAVTDERLTPRAELERRCHTIQAAISHCHTRFESAMTARPSWPGCRRAQRAVRVGVTLGCLPAQGRNILKGPLCRAQCTQCVYARRGSLHRWHRAAGLRTDASGEKSHIRAMHGAAVKLQAGLPAPPTPMHAMKRWTAQRGRGGKAIGLLTRSCGQPARTPAAPSAC